VLLSQAAILFAACLTTSNVENRGQRAAARNLNCGAATNRSRTRPITSSASTMSAIACNRSAQFGARFCGGAQISAQVSDSVGRAADSVGTPWLGRSNLAEEIFDSARHRTLSVRVRRSLAAWQRLAGRARGSDASQVSKKTVRAAGRATTAFGFTIASFTAKAATKPKPKVLRGEGERVESRRPAHRAHVVRRQFPRPSQRNIEGRDSPPTAWPLHDPADRMRSCWRATAQSVSITRILSPLKICSAC
jgi:hypothetical protein